MHENNVLGYQNSCAIPCARPSECLRHVMHPAIPHTHKPTCTIYRHTLQHPAIHCHNTFCKNHFCNTPIFTQRLVDSAVHELAQHRKSAVCKRIAHVTATWPITVSWSIRHNRAALRIRYGRIGKSCVEQCVAMRCSVLQRVAVNHCRLKYLTRRNRAKNPIMLGQKILCATVRCSVLQNVAVCCSQSLCWSVRPQLESNTIKSAYGSVLQCVAVCGSVLQCVAACCSALQYVGVCWSVLQCVGSCCSVLQCIGVCWGVLQFVAVCCSVW